MGRRAGAGELRPGRPVVREGNPGRLRCPFLALVELALFASSFYLLAIHARLGRGLYYLVRRQPRPVVGFALRNLDTLRPSHFTAEPACCVSGRWLFQLSRD